MYLGLGLRFGGSGAIGASIQLSANTVDEAATVGQTVGTLSVSNGSGSYTYSLTSNPGGLFAIDVADLEVGAALTAGDQPITVQADNGVDTPLTRVFTITVTSSAGVDGQLSTDFSLDGNIGLGVF